MDFLKISWAIQRIVVTPGLSLFLVCSISIVNEESDTWMRLHSCVGQEKYGDRLGEHNIDEMIGGHYNYDMEDAYEIA